MASIGESMLSVGYYLDHLPINCRICELIAPVGVSWITNKDGGAQNMSMILLSSPALLIFLLALDSSDNIKMFKICFDIGSISDLHGE